MAGILLISDLTWGGAAVACRRLCRALRGHAAREIQWIAARGEGSAEVRIASQWPPVVEFLLHRLVGRLVPHTARYWQRRLYEASALRAVRRLRPELINLHNIHDGVSFALVEQLPRRIPVVWTLHDMWPLTGYCCHSVECDKFADGCRGDCPQAGRWGEADATPERQWRRRQQCFSQNAERFAFVGPSRWMADQARRRFGDKARVEWIPNSLDLDVFKPLGNRRSARQMLGLPPDQPILLTGAHWAGDPLKGHTLLKAALQVLTQKSHPLPLVVAFGELLPGDQLPPQWQSAGFVRDERLMNLYYNAADAYVLPSLAENLPNMLIESIAAGTPGVAFDVGGCGEIVRDGETGFLARSRDTNHLAVCLERILELGADERERMRRACREVAEREYAPGLQAERYEELFEEMAAQPGSGQRPATRAG